MEIYLVRHGEAYPSIPDYYNYQKCTMDPPLTPKGEIQAKRLAKRFETLHFDHIYCSDLERAVQTAAIIKGNQDVELTVLEAFREINMGDIYLKPWDQYPKEHALWMTHKEDTPYPNGETGGEVWSRCSTAIQAIGKKAYTRVIIVCHGGTIRSIVSGALGLPQQKRFYLGLPLQNCSVSILIHRDGDFFVHSFNDSAHVMT